MDSLWTHYGLTPQKTARKVRKNACFALLLFDVIFFDIDLKEWS